MEIIQCLTSKLFQVITKLALQQLQKIIIIFISKWVRDCWLTSNVQFLSYITVKTRHIRWDGNEIRFVLDKHT
jgi:hypothetical protein